VRLHDSLLIHLLGCHSAVLEGRPSGPTHMTLTIERRTAGDVVVLDLRGRATLGSEADFLNEALRRELSAGTRKLLANLTDLVQVDSSGLAILVRTFVSMRRHGGEMLLVVLVMTWTGCVSNLPSALPNQPTTPAGNYPLTIVATGPSGVGVKIVFTVHVI